MIFNSTLLYCSLLMYLKTSEKLVGHINLIQLIIVHRQGWLGMLVWKRLNRKFNFYMMMIRNKNNSYLKKDIQKQTINIWET